MEFPSAEVSREASMKNKIFTMVKKMLEKKFAQQMLETAKQYQAQMAKHESEIKKIEKG